MKIAVFAISLLAALPLLSACQTPQKVAETAVSYTKCRAMQLEATTALKSIHAAQKDKKGARDTYSKTIGELGVDVEEAMHNYNIKLVEVSENAFRAQAVGTAEGVKGDVWEINDAGDLSHPKDGCAQ